MSTTASLVSLGDTELLDSTRALLVHSNALEADLLAHLAEVEQRKLHLERGFPSMFELCTEELGMSEGVAFNRIYVARLVRRLPALLDWVRSGRVHLSGLRLLAPHLTEANHAELLAEAAGKSKRQIELLVTRFDPKPPVPASIRKLPSPPSRATAPLAPIPTAPPSPATALLAPAAPPSPPMAPPAPPSPAALPPSRRPTMEPLTPDTFKMTLTIDGALRHKLKQAQDLLKHKVRDGDLAVIVEEALDLLIAQVKRDRFGVGRKPRPQPKAAQPGEGPEGTQPVTRHIPDATKRAVYERDGGRCTFVSPEGRRCAETGGLELDHLDGFAITHAHPVDRISLRCKPHNAHAAEKLYGAEKMARMKNSSNVTCPGTGGQELLL